MERRWQAVFWTSAELAPGAWADISKKPYEDKVGMLPIWHWRTAQEKRVGSLLRGERTNCVCQQSRPPESDLGRHRPDFLKWVVTS